MLFELLTKNEAINSNMFCRQLNKLSNAIYQKTSRINESQRVERVVFHHNDNVRSYILLETR